MRALAPIRNTLASVLRLTRIFNPFLVVAILAILAYFFKGK